MNLLSLTVEQLEADVREAFALLDLMINDACGYHYYQRLTVELAESIVTDASTAAAVLAIYRRAQPSDKRPAWAAVAFENLAGAAMAANETIAAMLGACADESTIGEADRVLLRLRIARAAFPLWAQQVRLDNGERYDAARAARA